MDNYDPDEEYKKVWRLLYDSYEAVGKCNICYDDVRYEDFHFHNSFPGSYYAENLFIICYQCNGCIRRKESLNVFLRNHNSNLKLQERYRLGLVKKEKEARELKIKAYEEENREKQNIIDSLNTEIRYNKLKIDQLCESFCETLVGDSICARVDCNHRISSANEVAVIKHNYANFEFHQINSDFLIITKPAMYTGHIVSPIYPHKVYFKLNEISQLTIYTEGNCDRLVEIKGFRMASKEEIKALANDHKMTTIQDYKIAAIAYLKYYFRKHRVSTIEKCFNNKNANEIFTQCYRELRRVQEDMRSVRRISPPSPIPPCLEDELKKLRIIL